MQLNEIARVVHAAGDLAEDGPIVTGVNFDSRTIAPGELFVPLVGERDGHDFIEAAAQAGAVATFVAADHEPLETSLPQLIVPDPLAALQELARYYLMIKVNPKVVAITGSNGKTTTKDMTAAILASQYRVTKTKDNFNNEIGVPITLLAMDTSTEVLVLEMGMDRPGQLRDKTLLVEPDVAVITMIGEAHIEFFKTRDKIADAKMEIVEGLKEDGLFVYNGDEPLLRERAEAVTQEKRSFGLDPTNQLYARDVVTGENETTFTTNRWPEVNFSIPVMGAYNVANALSALEVGRRFHISPEIMSEALKNFRLTRNRTEWLQGAQGEQILSDVYNSNPTAAIAVLQDFAEFSVTGRRIVVLADMLELGTDADAMHASLATAIHPEQIAEVYLYGDLMAALYRALVNRYTPEQLHWYRTGEQESLIAELRTDVRAGDKIMLKGSHGLHLENVVDALVAD